MQNIKPFIWTDGYSFYDTVNAKKYKNLPVIDSKKLVFDKIFEAPKKLVLTCIPTWSCNLRCPHCFVLKKLNKKFVPEKPETQKLKKFVEWHQEKYCHKKLAGIIVGGEPLLYPDVCLDYIETIKSLNGTTNMTTNLTPSIDDNIIKIFQLLDSVQVSIDGAEEVHNNTRFPYQENFNCFKSIICNLKILKKHNLIDNIFVAAGFQKDLKQKESRVELEFILRALGIKNMKFGLISESSYFNKSKQQKFTAMAMRLTPCCSFRYMSNFIIQGNKIYADYFDRTEKSLIGTLDDDFEKFPDIYKNYIKQNMPVLNDDVCLSCPALPICWGQCVGHTLYDNFIPSNFCDQKDMISRMTNRMYNLNILQKYDECDA